MLITLLLFLVSAVTIYLACEYFVNGIEWTGHHFKFSQSATGSLLAALGTALPECIVTLTALLMGNTTAQQEIGIGAALGGPLVLATIGYAAVGLTLLLCMGRTERAIDGGVQREIGRDQRWFIGIFLVATALGLANISGAMMIQGTIPKAFCLIFTPWLLDGAMMASSLVALLAVGLLWWGFRKGVMTAGRLALVGLLYLGFCGWLLVS